MSSNEITSAKTGGAGKILLYVISGIVVLILGFVLFATLMTNSSAQPPDFLGHRFFCMTTDGYAPKGDFVVAKIVSEAEISAGENIVYQDGVDSQNNPLIMTGRIQGMETSENESFFTLSPEDKPRPITDVLGTVAFALPQLGSWVLFIKTPLGLICCVALPLFFLLIFEIINLIRLSKTQKEEDEQFLEGDLPSYMQIDDEEPAVALAVAAREAAPPPVTDVFGKLSHNDLFEQQNETLEVVEPQTPFRPLSYQKPVVAATQTAKSTLYSTKEFSIADVQKAAAAASPLKKPAPPTVTAPKPEPSTVTSPKLAPVVSPPSTTNKAEFSTSMKSGVDNCFSIEGIGVRVKPDAVRLTLDNDVASRDISITVTKDYTNIVVESGDYQVDFAMLKADGDKEQKVIIQKKSRTINRK